MSKLTKLRDARERAFLSLQELADKAGVSKTTVLQIEAGRTEPQPRTIRKLAAALGVEPKELVDDA